MYIYIYISQWPCKSLTLIKSYPSFWVAPSRSCPARWRPLHLRRPAGFPRPGVARHVGRLGGSERKLGSGWRTSPWQWWMVGFFFPGNSRHFMKCRLVPWVIQISCMLSLRGSFDDFCLTDLTHNKHVICGEGWGLFVSSPWQIFIVKNISARWCPPRFKVGL